MASALPSVSDCCDTCVCNVIEVDLCPTSVIGSSLTVENTSALRLVLAAQRTEGMLVTVLTDAGVAFDGTGYLAIWRGAELTPDAAPQVTRPADVLTDLDPGRFMQFV